MLVQIQIPFAKGRRHRLSVLPCLCVKKARLWTSNMSQTFPHRYFWLHITDLFREEDCFRMSIETIGTNFVDSDRLQ